MNSACGCSSPARFFVYLCHCVKNVSLIANLFHLYNIVLYSLNLRSELASGAAKSDVVATLKAERSDLNCVAERSEVRA